MNKLEQKIKRINEETADLEKSRSVLLKILHQSKGGEGSGRYPSGSSGGGDAGEVFGANPSNPTASKDSIPRGVRDEARHQKELQSDNFHTSTVAKFRDMSTDSLKFVQADARQAAENMRGITSMSARLKESQYLDEVIYAGAELAARAKYDNSKKSVSKIDSLIFSVNSQIRALTKQKKSAMLLHLELGKVGEGSGGEYGMSHMGNHATEDRKHNHMGDDDDDDDEDEEMRMRRYYGNSMHETPMLQVDTNGVDEDSGILVRDEQQERDHKIALSSNDYSTKFAAEVADMPNSDIREIANQLEGQIMINRAELETARTARDTENVTLLGNLVKRQQLDLEILKKEQVARLSFKLTKANLMTAAMTP